MSFFPFFNNKKDEVALLLDIGNGSIGGAFVLFGEELPKVVYSVRLPFVISENLDSGQLSQGMETLLDETLGTVIKKGMAVDFWKKRSKKISNVLVSFSSPWFIEKTKDIHIEQEKTFVITKKFLDSILEKEEKTFQEELKTNAGGAENNFSIIEESIVHTKINGYTLDQSIGKKTQIFDLTICMAVLPKNIADKVENAVSKHTNISKDRIKMHTFPLISFTVLRDIFHTVENFIIMDITSEVTEMTLVKDGVIIQTVSFPFGRNSLIRYFSRSFNLPPELTESTLNLYNAGKTDPKLSLSIGGLLSDLEKEWAIYFEDALTGLSPKMILPKKIYTTVDADISHFMIDFMKFEKTDTTANFRKNLEITPVNHDLLSHLLQNNGGTNLDEFIEILAIFYNKMRSAS